MAEQLRTAINWEGGTVGQPWTLVLPLGVRTRGPSPVGLQVLPNPIGPIDLSGGGAASQRDSGSPA